MAFSPTEGRGIFTKRGAGHFHQRRGVAFSPKEGRGIFTKGGAWHFHLKEGRGIFT